MIKVISPGMYSSIQDKGRTGYRKYGVPLSGAMDMFHAQLANTLVGNTSNDAVVECTLLGPTLQFDKPTAIAICGAAYRPLLNDQEIGMHRLISIKAGDVLRLGVPTEGMRGYIAVKGGFQSQKIMGSRSMYAFITDQSRILKGDILEIASIDTAAIQSNATIRNLSSITTSEYIEVHRGPEYHLLSKYTQDQIEDTPLRLTSQSNRMGILLEGLTVDNVKEIITAPVQPGTVQLTPSGSCIILMRDAQTTGGYARILQLTEKAINKLAQKRPGEIIRFKFVSSML